MFVKSSAKIFGYVLENQFSKKTMSETVPGHIPDKVSTIPDKAGTVPDKVGTIPDKAGTIPDKAGTIPDKAGAIPDKVGTIPDKASIIPDIIGTITYNIVFPWVFLTNICIVRNMAKNLGHHTGNF